MKTGPERELEIIKFEIFQLESQHRSLRQSAFQRAKRTAAAVEGRIVELKSKQKLITNRIEHQRRTKQAQKVKEDPLVVL